MDSYQAAIGDFLAQYNAKLRKIVPYSDWNNQDDLQQYIWLAVLELEEQRGRRINFKSEEDRREILRSITRNYTLERRAKYRQVSYDQPLRFNGSEGIATALDLIAGPDDDDPSQAWIQRKQQEEDQEALQEQIAAVFRVCEWSYSQYSGYLILMSHFDLGIDQAASHLALTVGTLSERMCRAYALMRVQPSLFDRVVAITRDFLPPRRIALAVAPRSAAQVAQLTFDFRVPTSSAL